MSAAIAGMSRLRNTAVRRRNESSTTSPMNSGSLLVRTVEKSSEVAVWPPMRTWRPWLVEAGTTWFCVGVGGWWSRRLAVNRSRRHRRSRRLASRRDLRSGRSDAAHDTAGFRDRCSDGRKGGVLGGIVDLGDELERAVVAGPESLGEQVVGLTGGAAGWVGFRRRRTRGALRRTGSRDREQCGCCGCAQRRPRPEGVGPAGPGG